MFEDVQKPGKGWRQSSEYQKTDRRELTDQSLEDEDYNEEVPELNPEGCCLARTEASHGSSILLKKGVKGYKDGLLRHSQTVEAATGSTNNPNLFNIKSYHFPQKGFEHSTSHKKPPQNKLTCTERKWIIVPSNRPPKLTKAMQLWIDKTQRLLDPFRKYMDCWFHPSPPAPQVTSSGTYRPCGKIQKTLL